MTIMEKEVHYVLKRNTPISPEEIAMIDAASGIPADNDEENPEIDPVKTPELYAALVQSVAERNRRISKRQT